MGSTKLFESELKMMELLWHHEGASAKELAVQAAQHLSWNKNTAYTVIRRLVDKGAIRRDEPGFVCHSLVTRAEVGHKQAKNVLQSFFGGSVRALFASFMDDGGLSQEDAAELRRLINEHEPKG
ncbi:MAG: BlaI/MecI/CopY family transcriptional regulator [Micrococcales bacterium]|nr:BlaI/MecI/CopY family transcriptional regulator [Micrococcales bacterium]